MTSGWIPLHKALVRELPKDRQFTRLEAMFSFTLDYDQGNQVSVCGYSKLWGWSEGRVRRFVEEIGARIEYPENTASRQNQRGVIVIVIEEGSRSDNRGIKAIDSKWLATQTKGKRSDNGVKAEGSCTSTKEPNPNPFIYSDLFESLWKDYPSKDGRKAALAHFKATVKSEDDCIRIRKALDNYLVMLQQEKAAGFNRRPKNGSTWFNNWTDWEHWQPNGRQEEITPEAPPSYLTDPAFNEDSYDAA